MITDIYAGPQTARSTSSKVSTISPVTLYRSTPPTAASQPASHVSVTKAATLTLRTLSSLVTASTTLAAASTPLIGPSNTSTSGSGPEARLHLTSWESTPTQWHGAHPRKAIGKIRAALWMIMSRICGWSLTSLSAANGRGSRRFSTLTVSARALAGISYRTIPMRTRTRTGVSTL